MASLSSMSSRGHVVSGSAMFPLSINSPPHVLHVGRCLCLIQQKTQGCVPSSACAGSRSNCESVTLQVPQKPQLVRCPMTQGGGSMVVSMRIRIKLRSSTLPHGAWKPTVASGPSSSRPSAPTKRFLISLLFLPRNRNNDFLSNNSAFHLDLHSSKQCRATGAIPNLLPSTRPLATSGFADGVLSNAQHVLFCASLSAKKSIALETRGVPLLMKKWSGLPVSSNYRCASLGVSDMLMTSDAAVQISILLIVLKKHSRNALVTQVFIEPNTHCLVLRGGFSSGTTWFSGDVSSKVFGSVDRFHHSVVLAKSVVSPGSHGTTLAQFLLHLLVPFCRLFSLSQQLRMFIIVRPFSTSLAHWLSDSTGSLNCCSFV